MKTFVLNDEMYRFTVLLIVDCTSKQADAYLRRNFPKYIFADDVGACAYHAFVDAGIKHKDALFDKTQIIWIKDKDDYYSLSHELAHMAIHVFGAKSIPIQEETTEPFAYFFEYWNRKLWRIMSSL